MGTLSSKQRRLAYATLGRARLSELSELFDLEVEDKRVLDQHVNALVRTRRVDFEQVLKALSRSELQAICDALGLDRGGREKEVLVVRILTLADGGSFVDDAAGSEGQVVPVPNPAVAQVSHATWGVATPLSAGSALPPEPLRLKTDGPVVTEAVAQLERGGAGKPMSRVVVDAIRRQAEDVISEILQHYSADVAQGEVGAKGTARATVERPIVGRCPTGLLYGRIQSGKTNAMIMTSALALDNGFRTVIVFTSNIVKLVDQTLTRFRLLEGPLIYSSVEAANGEYQWSQDIGNIKRNIADKGLMIICAKDPTHQRALLELLGNVGAGNYPALIFDDEADQATPDTTTAARAQQRPNAPQQGSVTYRLTVENDAKDEIGQSTREILRHNVFLQVTATPYALLLQNSDSPIRPKFTRLLEPGDGYTGSERFFDEENVRHEKPPLVFVDESESEALASGTEVIPEGLAKAIVFFLISSSAYRHVARRFESEGFKFLCHTSPRTTEHEVAGKLIRNFVDSLSEELPDKLSAKHHGYFTWAREELDKSVELVPPLSELLDMVKQRLHLRKVLTFNSAAAQAEFGSSFNFMVGGNILGRGLTIDNLLVTYYLRRPQMAQMDTILQHARMYGYRSELLPFTRVCLPRSLAVRFMQIHDTETVLRQYLQDPTTAKIPVQVSKGLRATRANVLDVDNLIAFLPGRQTYPSQPEYRKVELGNLTGRIESMLGERMGTPVQFNKYVDVPIEFVKELVHAIRVRDDDGSWNPKAIDAVLTSLAPQFDSQAAVVVREFATERGTHLSNGVISGEEQKTAAAYGKPVLFMLREAGRGQQWEGVPFWYPTLVLPKSIAPQIVNADL